MNLWSGLHDSSSLGVFIASMMLSFSHIVCVCFPFGFFSYVYIPWNVSLFENETKNSSLTLMTLYFSSIASLSSFWQKNVYYNSSHNGYYLDATSIFYWNFSFSFFCFWWYWNLNSKPHHC
jgi:hypothetical protein